MHVEALDFIHPFELFLATRDLTLPTGRPTQVTMLVQAARPEEKAWVQQVARRLEHLLSLKEGWDSYRAPVVSKRSATAALDLLKEIMRPGVPTPAVVPTKHGTVQLEWHTRGIDLEIDVRSHTDLEVCFEDALTGEEWERKVSYDFRSIQKVLTMLRTRPR
jgi:hypothetical protein